MIIILDSEDLGIIRKYDLIDLSEDVYHPVSNCLNITGTQVRSIVKNILDVVWRDSTPYDDKYWLSIFGWRLTNNCL